MALLRDLLRLFVHDPVAGVTVTHVPAAASPSYHALAELTYDVESLGLTMREAADAMGGFQVVLHQDVSYLMTSSVPSQRARIHPLGTLGTTADHVRVSEAYAAPILDDVRPRTIRIREE